MADSVYEKIQQSCRPGVVDGKPVYITPHQHWLIGSYRDLRIIAPKLRQQPDLLSQLHVPEGIRFGSRKTDTFSTLSRLRSFRQQIKGQPPDVSLDYLLSQYQSVREAGHNGKVRLTDLYQLAREWYERATLEAHHIVEKDLLQKLGMDQGELDPNQAPCVLVVAELHRRLFTPEGSKLREEVLSANTKAEALQKLKECNDALYTSSLMSELRDVGNTIIDTLG